MPFKFIAFFKLMSSFKLNLEMLVLINNVIERMYLNLCVLKVA